MMPWFKYFIPVVQRKRKEFKREGKEETQNQLQMCSRRERKSVMFSAEKPSNFYGFLLQAWCWTCGEDMAGEAECVRMELLGSCWSLELSVCLL